MVFSTVLPALPGLAKHMLFCIISNPETETQTALASLSKKMTFALIKAGIVSCVVGMLAPFSPLSYL
jgi:hypothetical protein